jgi:PAS domain S-box-containing protein
MEARPVRMSRTLLFAVLRQGVLDVTLPETQTKTIGWIVAAAAAAAAAAVFALDLLTPFGTAVPMLYGIPLLITWFVPGPRSTFLMIGITMPLTLGGTLLSSGEPTTDVVVNRTMASVLLLVIGWLVINRKRLAEQRDADQAALRESEERFSKAFNEAAIGMGLVAPHGRWLKVNHALCDLVGYAAEELEATTFQAITHPNDLELNLASYQLLLGGEIRTYQMEKRYVHKQGHIIWVVVSVSLVRNSDGTPRHFITQIQDITERKRTEAALRESEEKFRMLAEAMPHFVWQTDNQGEAEFENQRWYDYTGLTHETTGHGGWLTVQHPDDAPRLAEAWKKAVETCGEYDAETRFRFAVDKTYRWFRVRGAPVRDAEGRIRSWVGTCSDIHDHKETEMALRQSEARFRTMAEAVPSFLFETDADGWNVWTSEGWCRFTGQTPHQVSGHGWAEALHPDDRTVNIDRWAQCMKDGVPFEAQQRLRRRDGIYAWVIARALPVRDSQGKVIRWVGSVTNVDDIVRVQEALRESEERFSKAFRASLHPIGITEVATGRCIEVNDACLQLFGFRRDEVIGNTTLILGIWPNQDARERLVERLKAGEPVRNLELSFKTRSGELRHILVSSDLAELSGTLCLITVGNDITERKQAEDNARRTAADLAEAQRIAKVGSWRLDIAADRVWLSDQLYDMFEVEPSPLGETYESFLARVHLDDRPGVVQANLEARMHGTPFEVEFRIVTRDGSVKVMHELGYANRDAVNRVVGLFGTVQDVTDRKRVETALRESEERLMLALESANMGTWEWDGETDSLLWNHWQFTLFGVRPEDFHGTGVDALSRIHAEDRARVAASLRRVMEEGVTVGEEFRVVHADGSVHWLFTSGRPVQDQHGRSRYVVGVSLDITERRRDQERVQSLNEILEARVRERTAALAEANERWDWVVRATQDGVWDWDLLRDTAYFSPRWKEMHGFQESDRPERTKEWATRIYPEDRPRVMDALERCRTGTENHFHEEYRIQRKDGTYMWVLDQGLAVFNDQGRAFRMIGAESDITALKSSEALLREREAQLSELSARLLRAQEVERRRISRDLHDDIMQRMGALTLDLYGLASSAASPDGELQSQLKTCGASAEQLTTDLQRMAHQLHPSILEFIGLEVAAREHIHEFATRTGLSAELQTRNLPKDFPLDHATCLYRVLQEGLNNVQKHAAASTVLVRLLGTGRGVGLCVHDDGQGIEEVDRTARRKGLGLTSMAERVGILNGTFRVWTKPGEGTELHAWIPFGKDDRGT